MDQHTLDKLDFDRIRQLLAEQARCGLGRSLAMRITPGKQAGQIKRWMEQAAQFFRWTDAHGLPPFGGIRDVRDHVKRAVPPAKLEPEEFAELAATLDGIGTLRRFFAEIGDDYAALKPLAERIGDLSAIAQRIGRVIDARGRVRDEASERLSRIRRDIDDVRDQTRTVIDRLLKQPGLLKYLQYPNATFHAERMVLPLKAEQRGRINGIVHRSSDSGQTLFVEPAEAVELNNRRIELLQAEKEEINRILWELTHLVHINQAELLNTLNAVAVIDLLTAKHQLAKRFNMTLPEINDGKVLKLNGARNPILMAMYDRGPQAVGDATPSRTVVPINVRLGDDFDIMMITGPNTGGKTAALKTVGLLVLMAQSGLPIPADAGSTMPVFNGMWIDVGDEQSLQQSLSTFSAHLGRILDIVQRARESTLVLLDELGAGTDPDEGAAIGRAIIEHLLSRKCLAMITTHLGALKALGFEIKRIDNASVMFDLETLRPTYELLIGEPGNSNAIAIASRLGMPKALVGAARKHLAGRQRALNKAIAGTLRARRDAERARQDADQARVQAAREMLAAKDVARALEDKRRVYEAWVQRITKLQPGERVRVRNFDDIGRILRIRLDKQQASVEMGTMQLDVPLSDLIFDVTQPTAVR